MSAETVPCSLTTLDGAARHDFCKLGNRPDQKPNFIVWADSHGVALRRAFFDLAEKEGSAGLLTSVGGCPPLLDIVIVQATPEDCVKISETVFDFIRSMPSITRVILVARWAYYVEGARYKDEPTDRFTTKTVSLKNLSGATEKGTRAVVSRALDQTVTALRGAGKHVWIVGPVPEIGLNFPKALYLQAMGLGRETDIAPLRADFDQRQANVVPMIRSVAQKHAVGIVWPHEILCTAVSCAVTSKGRPLYLDDNHLSDFGATVIKPAIEKMQISK
jgi:SGNH domain (fused to AT3 domains)